MIVMAVGGPQGHVYSLRIIRSTAIVLVLVVAPMQRRGPVVGIGRIRIRARSRGGAVRVVSRAGAP